MTSRWAAGGVLVLASEAAIGRLNSACVCSLLVAAEEEDAQTPRCACVWEGRGGWLLAHRTPPQRVLGGRARRPRCPPPPGQVLMSKKKGWCS
jgi:hypothetical protein